MTKPLRILSVLGTRPEAVKMAPVIQALNGTPGIVSLVCVTAQHRQMLDQVLDLFGIKPDFDLNLMQPDQALAALTAKVFTHLDPVLQTVRPDWVLVQGDTTTVMATSLLSYYHHIQVGHVEAGLRTGDKWQPFPEEINRRVAGVVADLHFAPTEHSRQNLRREGVPDHQIVVTGNPVIDALHTILRLPMPVAIQQLLERLRVRPGERQLILVTAHRRENFGQPLENICQALRQLAEAYSQQTEAKRVELVYPVHLNPHVQDTVQRTLKGVPNITLLPPLDYLPMVHLMRQAKLVLTDSGGIQEEATALGIPTLVLRRITERPEGVEVGALKLVGSDTQTIFNESSRLLEDPVAYQQMTKARNPFGDGNAASKIVRAILEHNSQTCPPDTPPG